MTVCMITITFTLGRFPDNTNDQLWSLQNLTCVSQGVMKPHFCVLEDELL